MSDKTYCEYCQVELGDRYYESLKLKNAKFCSRNCLDLEKSDLELTKERE